MKVVQVDFHEKLYPQNHIRVYNGDLVTEGSVKSSMLPYQEGLYKATFVSGDSNEEAPSMTIYFEVKDNKIHGKNGYPFKIRIVDV